MKTMVDQSIHYAKLVGIAMITSFALLLSAKMETRSGEIRDTTTNRERHSLLIGCAR